MSKGDEGTMRTKMRFLSAASLAALTVLAATAAPAMAAEPLPMACTSVGTGAFRIEVIEGPCLVSNENSPACAASGLFTGIKYRISGAPPYIVTLARYDTVVSGATGNIVYAPGVGDSVTGFGRLVYHERAVRLNSAVSTTDFWLVVQGTKAPVLESFLAKKGTYRAESCMIAGLGVDRDTADHPTDSTDACVPGCGNFHPDQVLKATEVLTFKGCSVIFRYDIVTGQVIDAHLTDDSVECDFFTANVGDLQVTLNVSGGGSLGLGKFGDGYISTGTESCTSRIIAGRVYTWGSPCPN